MATRSTRWIGIRSAVGPHDGSGDGADRSRVGDVTALAGRNGVAAEHLAEGRLDRAVTALESLLNDCRWLLGGEHPGTLVVEGNLAVAYVMIGQAEAGEHLMLANLAGRERVFGDEHALTLTARDAMATTFRLAGRLSEALWLYSRVAPQRNRVLGSSHPDTLTTRLGFGLTLAESGDTAMALDVVTAALQDCAGTEHEHAAVLRACLADLRRAGAAAAQEAGSTVSDPAAGVTTVPPQRAGSEPGARDPSAGQRGGDDRLRIDIGSGTGLV